MIKLFTSKKDFLHYRHNVNHQSIGVVPTMGNLHEGHLSLLKKSVEENLISVVTIFVNPKQFGPNEDFQKYPRTLDDDLAKISNIALHTEKEIIVYAPQSINDIYPLGFNTVISVKGLSEKLEGQFRRGHFDGVCTVVYQLFNTVKARKAYFGQKDFQQCAIIQKMIQDLNLDIDFIRMPIIRNAEGLALSSRNQYLSSEERIEALILIKTLKEIEQLILNQQNYQQLIDLKKSDTRWDYLEVLDANTLDTPNNNTRQMVIIGTFRMNSARLLDNILVTKP